MKIIQWYLFLYRRDNAHNLLPLQQKELGIMLIYNTTYQVEMGDTRKFVIWLNEYYIPEAEKTGELTNPHILRILSHKEQDSECFSVQWEVADSAVLHRWYTICGAHLNEELMKTFKDKVIGFPTIMEVIR